MDDIGNIIYFILAIVGLIAGFFQNRKKQESQKPVAQPMTGHPEPAHPTVRKKKVTMDRPSKATSKRINPANNFKKSAFSEKRREGRVSKQLEVIELDDDQGPNSFEEIDISNPNWREAIILSEVLNRRTYGKD